MPVQVGPVPLDPLFTQSKTMGFHTFLYSDPTVKCDTSDIPFSQMGNLHSKTARSMSPFPLWDEIPFFSIVNLSSQG